MDFDSLDDFHREINNNPLKQLIGQDIEIECPNCKREVTARVINDKEVKCNKCNEIITVDCEIIK